MAPSWSKLLQQGTPEVSVKNIIIAASIVATLRASVRAITWSKRNP